jgi:hypothetical protein
MPTPALPHPTGLQLRPFQAVRYHPAQASDLSNVICPPYDDIGPVRACSLRVRPHHIARLLYAHDPLTAAGQLDRWRQRGVLVRDARPAIYVYQQQRGARILQRGLIGELSLDRGTTGPVLPHEDVQPHVVTQRAGSMAALRAQLEPLLLTYRSAESTTAGDSSFPALLRRGSLPPPAEAGGTREGIQMKGISGAVTAAAAIDCSHTSKPSLWVMSAPVMAVAYETGRALSISPVLPRAVTGRLRLH